MIVKRDRSGGAEHFTAVGDKGGQISFGPGKIDAIELEKSRSKKSHSELQALWAMVISKVLSIVGKRP